LIYAWDFSRRASINASDQQFNRGQSRGLAGQLQVACVFGLTIDHHSLATG